MAAPGRLTGFFDRFRKRFRGDSAMDMGTVNTRVYVKHEGIVVHEPSLIAVDGRTNRSIALGRAAERLADHPRDRTQVMRPLRGGVIADSDAAAAMMQGFIRMAFKGRPPSRLHLVMTVPADITQVERRAVKDCAYEAGARSVLLINGLMSSAMGAGLDVETSRGTLIADIGGGSTEVGVIRLGAVVHAESVRVGSDEMDEAIVRYFQRSLHLHISRKLAENIKVRIGCAIPGPDEHTMTVTAKRTGEGSLRTVDVTSSQISEALERPVDAIVDTVRRTLENAPAALLADVRHGGLILTGGGCLLENLDELITRMTGIKVIRAPDPIASSMLGCAIAAEDSARWQKVFSP